ncbi:hypothetical protein GCM10009804_70890 [Kribbella hippodromi]|uniref:NAD-dependent epimerase/dehydratase domain-containing protein n=1 Tax=Kribbella hippodromi TaxID=434347 RepID=A0ABN2EIH9_9ACTN
MTRLLVVGGSGLVGRTTLPGLMERYDVRVLDLQPPAIDRAVDFVSGDATDYQAVAGAARGCDGLLYLAMGPKAGWESGPEWTALQFDVNVKGLYQSLTAAFDAGCSRAAVAGSMSVYADYLAPEAERPVPDADDVYGLTKRLGEQVAQSIARSRQRPVVALRLVGPMSDEDWQEFRGPHQNVMTAASDVARAFAAALKYTPPAFFDTFVVTGDHASTSLDWSRSRDLLGWAPLARRKRQRISDAEH